MALSNLSAQRTPQIKVMVSICLQTLIERMCSAAPRSREIERMLPILSTHISDANSDVRMNAKSAFMALYKEMLTRRDFE
mmetsp:Transcript_23547/g.11341  ORF Transcript_23547/g.11341 Transcript_23547/m.11341 type:complete len:80 (-) Transcript_23547:384-623(-)